MVDWQEQKNSLHRTWTGMPISFLSYYPFFPVNTQDRDPYTERFMKSSPGPLFQFINNLLFDFLGEFRIVGQQLLNRITALAKPGFTVAEP